MREEPGSEHRPPTPTPAQIRRWRQYLADERAEAAVYRDLAGRRDGEERDILLALADAEQRHEQHWLTLLGTHVGPPKKGAFRTRLLGWMARRFGGVFVLALAQRAEHRSPYDADADATAAMAADERIHAEVVRGLAARGRAQLSGSFRAAVFGINDGLVSNLALVLGIGATGVSTPIILATGVAGLLAGALSMAAGEYVSVRSQRELVSASEPGEGTRHAVVDLDVNANELELIYRARGMSAEEAQMRALQAFASIGTDADHDGDIRRGPVEELGSARAAAISSFFFFASGALLPVLPYLLGFTGVLAIVLAAVIVGVALLVTGGIVGLLAGASPLSRGIRQLAIGYGAAAATYLLGLAFGAIV